MACPLKAQEQPKPDNASCLECHGDASAQKHIPVEKFKQSVHGGMDCIACHSDISAVPHDTPLKPVRCADCHQLESEVYLASDHGMALRKGNREAASCRDCHGNAHEMLDSRNPQSPVFRAKIPRTCAGCHGNTQQMHKYHLNQNAPVASYLQSVHGLAQEKGKTSAAVCTDCHGSHDLHKATNHSSKLFWRNIPATCGKCHENIKQSYQRSVHGKAVAEGKREAPVCTDCHGEHSIDAVKLGTSRVSGAHIPETCGQCHAAERITSKFGLPPHVLETYMGSIHGLAQQLGSVTAANCASCHGAHDILPSDDPRSSVYPNNLPKTCGRCHAGVGEKVARGQIHSGTMPGLEHRVVSIVRRFYVALIFLVVGGMVLHNATDFLKKLLAHHRRMAALKEQPRMTWNERLQHVVLILAFVSLAYTGFALKYPHAWWASPFMGRVDWRSAGHRLAALFFGMLVIYHAGFLLFTKRGRREWTDLLPHRIDAVQFFQMLAYYAGRTKQRPVFGRYSYVEKAEYWALVWGSVVMVLTGVLMSWSSWTLQIFPKWFFDVVTAVHFYEAVLACLAIVVWHGYFTILDPDEYPMKLTWITGENSPADRRHRRQEPPKPPNGAS